jgi:hypothetical protein
MEMKNQSTFGNSSKGNGNGSAKKAHKAEPLNSSSENGDRPHEHMIANAAYFNAERRGFAPGNEMDDWLEAEAEMKRAWRNPEAV